MDILLLEVDVLVIGVEVEVDVLVVGVEVDVVLLDSECVEEADVVVVKVGEVDVSEVDDEIVCRPKLKKAAAPTEATRIIARMAKAVTLFSKQFRSVVNRTP